MRFAHEHAPKAPRRSFWLLAGLFFLLLAVPIAAFNLAVDPFDFRLLPHLSLIREKIVRQDDTILWSAGELRRIPQRALDDVTVVVCGDSRAELLTGRRFFPRIFQLGQDHVLSLSAGGASFDESVKLLEMELPRLPRLRAVIFAAPLERVGAVESDRVANAIKIAHSPVLYALSLGTLEYSSSLLAGQTAAAASRKPARERPEVDPEHLVDVTSSWLDISAKNERAKLRRDKTLTREDESVVDKWKEKLAEVDEALVNRRVEKVLTPLAQKLRERHARVIFYFPPLHPEVAIAFRDPKLAELHHRYRERLSGLGAVEDFSRDDHGIVYKFADGSHVNPEVGQAIMADIYLRNLAKDAVGQPGAPARP